MFDFIHIISPDPDISLVHNSLHEKYLFGVNWKSEQVHGVHFKSEYFYYYEDEENGYLKKDNIHIFSLGRIYLKKEYNNTKKKGQLRLFAKDILDLYISYGEKIINCIKGNFLLFIADEEKKRYIAIPGRSGLYRLYYYFENNKLIISSSMSSILKNMSTPAEINIIGLVQHALFTYPLDSNTHINNVNILDNHHYLSYNLHELKLIKYYDIIDAISKSGIYAWNDFLKNSVPEFNDVMQTIISDGPINCAFTGGYDSRTILSYLLYRRKSNFQLYSWGDNYKYSDVGIPLYISKKLGLNYNPIKLDEDMLKNYDTYCDQHIYWTDGCGSINRANQMYGHKVLFEYSNVTLMGYYGSEIIRSLGRHTFAYNELFIDMLLNPENRYSFLQNAINDLKRKKIINTSLLNKFDNDIKENIITCFNQLDISENKSINYIAYILKTGMWKFYGQEVHAQRIHTNIITPFGDDDFLDFVLKGPIIELHKDVLNPNPITIIRSQGFYHPILRHNYPELMKYKTSRGFAPNSFNSILFPLNLLLMNQITKLKQRIWGKPGFNTYAWNSIVYQRDKDILNKQNEFFYKLYPENLKTGFWFSLKKWIDIITSYY